MRSASSTASQAAVAIAISSGGAISKIETTVLMTVEETLDALGRTSSISYRRPGE